MPFDLAINGADFFIVLPITLLDMGHPQPIADPEEMNEFQHGVALLSDPFELRGDDLPSFLGGFSLSSLESREAVWLNGLVIGGCTMKVPFQEGNGWSKRRMVVIRFHNESQPMISVGILNGMQTVDVYSNALLQLLYFLLVRS